MNLAQLFLQNQTKTRNFRVKNDGDEATMYLYDVIGGDWYGGISSQDFAKELSAITAKTVHLRINSPGGDVFEGRAMQTAIRQFDGTVIAHIDGVAASAASGLAVACDQIEIADGAFFMIHNAWTFAMGDKNSMLEMAALLDKIDQSIVTDYAKRTGKTTAEIETWMNAETWFTAQEAIDNGFADRMAEEKSQPANQWNLSAYQNAPKIVQPNPENEIVFDRAAAERRLKFLALSAPQHIAA